MVLCYGPTCRPGVKEAYVLPSLSKSKAESAFELLGSFEWRPVPLPWLGYPCTYGFFIVLGIMRTYGPGPIFRWTLSYALLRWIVLQAVTPGLV